MDLRLDIQSTPARLRVIPGSLNISASQLPLFENARVSTTPYRFSISQTDSTELSIDWSAVRRDLGYLDPLAQIQRMSNRSLSSVPGAVQQIVAKGQAVRNNPSPDVVISMIKASGVKDVQTEIGASPNSPIVVSFTPPSDILTDFAPGSVSVRTPDFLRLDADWERTRSEVVDPGSVRIRVVPTGRRLDFNA